MKITKDDSRVRAIKKTSFLDFVQQNINIFQQRIQTILHVFLRTSELTLGGL